MDASDPIFTTVEGKEVVLHCPQHTTYRMTSDEVFDLGVSLLQASQKALGYDERAMTTKIELDALLLFEEEIPT